MIVLNPNPSFVFRAYWYAEPKQVIKDHWITKEFGFEVFNSANPVDDYLYIRISRETLFKAIPLAVEQKINLTNVLSNYK